MSQLVSSQQASLQSLKKCWQWAIILCVSLRTILDNFYFCVVSSSFFVSFFVWRTKIAALFCSQAVYSLIKAQVNIGKLSSIVYFFHLRLLYEHNVHIVKMWGMRFHHYRPAAMMEIKNDTKRLTNSSSMPWKIWSAIKIINYSSREVLFQYISQISFLPLTVTDKIWQLFFTRSLIFIFCRLL